MAQSQTEKQHPKAIGLDTLPGDAVLNILLDGQVAAANAVRAVIPDLEKGAELMAQAMRTGGKIVYAAAGSSGLMGLADGLEITPTFGIPNSRISILRAGGLADMHVPKGHAEDDIEAAIHDARDIGPNDCVICLAASGNTPYPVEIMRVANAAGAATIGISNNPDAKLLRDGDVAILLATPPEVIAGSTRLGAGTAQKITLNMMSTLMGVKLGHVMDGLMVNVITNNEKLLIRARKIVMAITGCNDEAAKTELAKADGSVKLAILLVFGAPDLPTAQHALDAADQNLRAAISSLKT